MQAFMNRSAFENNIHQVEIKGCGGLSWRKEHNTGATLSEGEEEKWDYKRRINENTRSSITAHVFIRSSVLKPYMGLSGLAFSLVVALASTGCVQLMLLHIFIAEFLQNFFTGFTECTLQNEYHLCSLKL